jgi:hypothetical protein
MESAARAGASASARHSVDAAARDGPASPSVSYKPFSMRLPAFFLWRGEVALPEGWRFERRALTLGGLPLALLLD